MSLDIVEFRRIIEGYYSRPRPDPFLEWFCSHDREFELRTSFERVLVILVDARFDQATKAESALENTRRICRAGLIRQEPARSLEEIPELIPVEGMTSEKWRNAFNVAHKPLIELARAIIEKQKWSANELAKRIDEVSYFGPKTYSMSNPY